MTISIGSGACKAGVKVCIGKETGHSALDVA